MSDIVERIRTLRFVHVPMASQLFEEAACEIERLNREVSILIAECQRQKDLLVNGATLTDAEREALHHVVGDVADITGPVEDAIRGLLERLR